MTFDGELARRRAAGCLSDRALDGLAAGELAPAARVTVDNHLAGCTACTARARELEAVRRAFPIEAPSFESLVTRNQPVPRRRWVWPSLGAGLVAAFATLVLVVGPAHPPTPQLDQTRNKGADHLSLFVLHAGAPRAAAPGEIVRPGDHLQLAYTAAQDEHLAILSRDAAGGISVLFPPGETAMPIKAVTLAPLPHSLELGPELGVVTVYGVFCPRAEPLGSLLAAVDRVQPPGPTACHVDALTYDVRP